MNVQSEINRQAAAFLYRQNAKQFVFISSMSAHGRGREHVRPREVAYRKARSTLRAIWPSAPGFIIGPWGRVSRNLAKSIRKLPLVPLFLRAASSRFRRSTSTISAQHLRMRSSAA